MKKTTLVLLCLISVPTLVLAQEYLLVLNKSGDSAWQLNAKTGEKTAEYQTETGPHEVALSPNKNKAAVTNYGSQQPGYSISIIDLREQKIEKIIDLKPYQRPHGIQWFRGGNRIVVSVEAQQAVAIVDVIKGRIEQVIKTNKSGSHMVELSRDEQQIYVPNRDSGTLSILSIADGNIIKTLSTGAGTEGITLADNGSEIWTTNRDANTLSIVDSQTLSTKQTLKSERFPIRAEASPNGEWVAVSNAQSDEISIFDAHSKDQLANISTTTADGKAGVPLGLVFSTNSRQLYVSNSEADQIVVIDTATWKITKRFGTGDTPDGIAYFKIQ